ncbi:MAG: AAA family ATPase, partial [Saprospiraceae bacterium]
MDNQLIGRIEEKEILENALRSNEAEMIAVIGRRRVGKTFLIKTVYEEQIAFEVTGIQNSTKQEQLQNFMMQLSKFSKSALPLKIPKSWLEAFFLLSQYLDKLDFTEKKVVFLDELPWLATHKSGFLNGLSWFWNSWAVNKNVVVAICGSAASWMIRKVVNNRGGLYNRITKRIYLSPFTLHETEIYLQSRNIQLDRYQITQLYMSLGGIPHHLKEVKNGKTGIQNINQICFSPNGLLRDEFLRLYPALFAHADNHIKIIRTLGNKPQGLTRNEIIELSNVSAGGSMTRTLEELEHSGFITAYRPYRKKKKTKLYRLTDEYSLFYLKFIEGNQYEGNDTWHHLSQTQIYKTWSGYAFESICLKHIPQIKKALGISGIYSVSSAFYHKGTKEIKGTQIDLLIDRKDRAINLVEIKFYNEPITISKSYAENLRTKQSVFRAVTKTPKQLFTTFISTFGINDNQHSLGLIAQSLTLDDLFLEI